MGFRIAFDTSMLRMFDLKTKFKSELQADKDGSAFGGFSGGPVCVFGYDGFYLVGITSECKKFGDLYIVTASPISAIVDDLKNKCRSYN